MTREEYLKYWIQYLVSDLLIFKVDFDYWMHGFEERYTPEDLISMKMAWQVRKAALNALYASLGEYDYGAANTTNRYQGNIS